MILCGVQQTAGQGAEAALPLPRAHSQKGRAGQQRARPLPAGSPAMEQPSLPSAGGCCPQNRKAPASLPWSTSPPTLLGQQQQQSGDEVAGKQGTSQEGRQLHPRAFLNKASEYLTVHCSGLHFMPSGESGLLEGSTLKYLLSLLM